MQAVQQKLFLQQLKCCHGATDWTLMILDCGFEIVSILAS